MIRTYTYVLFICVCIIILTKDSSADNDLITLQDVKVYCLADERIPGHIQRITLSPDCTIAAIELIEKQNIRLCLFNLTTKERIFIDPRIQWDGYVDWKRSSLAQLYDSRDFDVQWNPSLQHGKRWISFVSNGIENQEDVFLYNVDEKKYIRVTSSFGQDQFPRWSPDGSKLFYIHSDEDKSMLYVIPDFNSISRRIDQTILAYTDVPILSSVFEKDVFSKNSSIQEFKFDAIDQQPVWYDNDKVLVPSHSFLKSHSLLLKIIELSEKRISDVKIPIDININFFPFPSQNKILFVTNPFYGKRDRSAFQLNKLTETSGGIVLETLDTIPLDDLLEITPVLNNDGYYIANSKNHAGRLSLYKLDRNELKKTNISFASADNLESQDFFSLTARYLPNAVPDSRLLLSYVKNEKDYFATGSFNSPRTEDEDVPRSKIIFDMGFVGSFGSYTGDAATGDFIPAGNAYATAEPFHISYIRISFGFGLGYVALSGSSKTLGSFSKYLWYGEGLIKTEYELTPEFEPFFLIVAGKGILNEKLTTGARRKPVHFGLGAGIDFHLTSRIDLEFDMMYRKLTLDIDHLKPLNPREDSFINIGFGMNYKFSL